MIINSVPLWHTLGASVTGATHWRHNAVCQDALSISETPPGGSRSPCILALSDGHGGKRYFRSDIGARIAVTVMKNLLKRFEAKYLQETDLSLIKRIATERLPKKLVREWKAGVALILEQRPGLLQEGKEHLSAADLALIEQSPHLAFGATVLGVLVSQNFILYLQLGDGDVLSIQTERYGNGRAIIQRVLPPDAHLFANETTSLCMPDAWRYVRVRFQVIRELIPPTLILATTDGYINSFREEADFLAVGSDMLQMLQTDGVAVVKSCLPGWLEEASRLGSGDDVTLALICREEGYAELRERKQEAQ